MNVWDHLPNAKLIDQVLSELRANPEEFAAAWEAANDAAGSAAWEAAWSAACNAAWFAVWSADRDAAWSATGPAVGGAVGGAANDAANDAAKNAAWDAINALIAYDDSAKYLDMTYEELQSWAILSEDPAAILLLPYVWVREHPSKVCA